MNMWTCFIIILIIEVSLNDVIVAKLCRDIHTYVVSSKKTARKIYLDVHT